MDTKQLLESPEILRLFETVVEALLAINGGEEKKTETVDCDLNSLILK